MLIITLMQEFYKKIKKDLGHRVGIDLLDDHPDPQPDGQVCEHFYHAALVREGRFLEDGQVPNHPVVDNVLHDLVHKINLAAVQLGASMLFLLAQISC